MLIIAHRGACKYAPENTLPAFRKALDLGVDGVEFDVQLTKDKVPIVIHSDNLSPLTTTYTFVQQTPLRALQTIDAGSVFGPTFAGERIPTLEAVLALFADAARSPQHTAHSTPHAARMLINIELKVQPYWHFGLEELTVALVRQFGLADRVIFSSFSPLVLWRLKRAAPEIRRALLVEPRAFFFLRTRFFGKVLSITHLHPFHETTTSDFVARTRAAGWQVITWTVNSRAEMERAMALGVEGIITDDPVLAREVRDAHVV